ncbi:MAG: TlpA disulfide reductase family protein [Candidatus Bipolaricaulota bacterium]|nr:TlpA disulfide reductase family protein [Candidatus Bipolaricaulota bacterium]
MRAAAAVCALLLVACAAAATTVPLEYVGDITLLTTSCALHMIKVSPDGTDSGALSGILTLAGERRVVRIASPTDGATLAVDLAGDGTTTLVEWDQAFADGTLIASPEFILAGTESQTASYRTFLMWSPFLPVVVTYCRDNYRSGALETAGRTVALAVVDDDTNGRFDDDAGTLFVDVDGDGQLLTDADSHERFGLYEPFVIDGTTYVATSVAADGSWAEIETATVPALPKPPLLDGFPAPGFTALDAQGSPVDVASLRGKIVLLDFWAAWCAPCLEELPTIASIHEALSDQGVVVLGVNLDRSDTAFRDALARLALPYVQIYDGSDGPISSLYRIGGIPMTYLIGRDGVIRARGLRGGALVAAIEALLGEEPES